MEASFDSGSMKVTFRGLIPSPTLQASQNVTQIPVEVDMEGPLSAATHSSVKGHAQEFSGATAKQVVLTPLEICDS